MSSYLKKAPKLLSTRSYEGYANGMFNDSQVNEITCLSVRTVSYLPLNINRWVNIVPPNGTFTKYKGSYWSTGPNGIPAGWTVIEILP